MFCCCCFQLGIREFCCLSWEFENLILFSGFGGWLWLVVFLEFFHFGRKVGGSKPWSLRLRQVNQLPSLYFSFSYI